MPDTIELDDPAAELLRSSLKLDKFLTGMTTHDIKTFFPQSGLSVYPKESHIIEQGETSRDVYIIVSGKVSITQVLGAAGTQLGTLKAGDVFGEGALLRDGKRVASAIAEEECRIYRLAFADVDSLLTGNPTLGQHLKDLAAERSL